MGEKTAQEIINEAPLGIKLSSPLLGDGVRAVRKRPVVLMDDVEVRAIISENVPVAYGGAEGSINDSSFYNDAAGDYSVALGRNCTSPGDYSIALGKENNSEGMGSVALGLGNIANGNYSVAEGLASNAVGKYSHCENSCFYTPDNDALEEFYLEFGANETSGRYNNWGGYGMDVGGVFFNDQENLFAKVVSMTPDVSGGVEGTMVLNNPITRIGITGSPRNFYYLTPNDFNHYGAFGNASHAEGSHNAANGDVSHVEGFWNVADGDFSHSEGHQCTSRGDNSHAEGNGSCSKGRSSHAEGSNCYSVGAASHSEGWTTHANEDYSHAEGHNTKAFGKGSHAEGIGSQALGDGSHVEGYAGDNYTTRYPVRLTGSANTTVFTYVSGNRPNVGDVLMYNSSSDTYSSATVTGITGNQISTNEALNNDYAIVSTSTVYVFFTNPSSGGTSIAYGNNSHVEGEKCKTVGVASHAEGYNNTSYGGDSHAEGNGNVASGTSSHVEGSRNKALGRYSHSEGYQTVASGESSHSEGRNTVASGMASHAEGSYTNAQGDNAHAEGYYSYAFGYASHTEGVENNTNAESSHCEGYYNRIDGGFASHAEGYGVYEDDDWYDCDIRYADVDERDYMSTYIGKQYMFCAPGDALPDATIFKLYDDDADEYYDVECCYYDNEFGVDFFNMTQESLTRFNSSSKAQDIGEQSTIVLTIVHLPSTNSQASHKEGYTTCAIGKASHSEGSSTVAKGDYSHAEGLATQALGYASHTEGSYNVAYGNAAHIEGSYNHLYGNYSHVEGHNNVALNHYEHAEGFGNKSHKPSNLSHISGLTVSSIGIGGYVNTSDGRRNAVEVMANGDVYIYGINNYDGITASGNTVQQLIQNLQQRITNLGG